MKTQEQQREIPAAFLHPAASVAEESPSGELAAATDAMAGKRICRPWCPPSELHDS